MSNTQHAMPDARDNRIAELETQVDDLTDTVQSQRNTIDALQQTNQLLAEQLEEKCKQLESSNEQFLNSRGLNFSQSDSALQRSLSIDENSSFNKEYNIENETHDNKDKDKYLGNNAESILEDYDDIYSSGEDIETYKTKIHDDHELLPLKQGTLKKKSENMHRYNNRYVVLYPSFLLYYDQCPIKPGSKRKNSISSSFTSKNTSNNDINHPKGTIYLRNYHVAIRKDDKKKRFDITFVPHDSAVMMGLAACDARIRFRCKNVTELLEWTDKIRTAITSANSGFIKYDVRTDFISNDLSNLNQATGDNDNKDENIEESKDKTKMFDINDLKEMMKKEEELQNEIAITKRMINKLEQEKDALVTELEIAKNEILQGERVSKRREEGLEAKMKELKAHEKTLRDEIENLRNNINKLEQKQKEQHKKLKRYKHHEQDIIKNIELMQKWNKKMEENSLQYLGQIYPNCSNKQLFETCQKGCVGLLEEIYSIRKKNKDRNSDIDHEVDDSDCKIEQNSKKRKESKISQEIIGCFIKLFRKHIKTTINYASLQQAHNGVVEDFKLLKQNVDDYDAGNTLEDDALIMASMTATLF
eukprot:278495_1